MDHSIYAYLTRRTTEELTVALSTVSDSEDEMEVQIAIMIREILSSRGLDF